jgi:hypothetical protein
VTTSVPIVPLGALRSLSAFLMALAPAPVSRTFVPLSAKTVTVDLPERALQRAAVTVTDRVPFLSFSPPWRLEATGKTTLPPPALAGATALTLTPADASALAGVNVAV